jgi:hypothetical protein
MACSLLCMVSFSPVTANATLCSKTSTLPGSERDTAFLQTPFTKVFKPAGYIHDVTETEAKPTLNSEVLVSAG